MPTFNPSSQTVGRPGNNPILSVPSYCQGGWVIAIPPGALDDADNSGNAITTPATQIGAAKLGLRVNGATELLVACFYPSATADGKITADPVVQAFGKDVSGIYQRLFLSSDGTTHELTLTAAETADLITPCSPLGDYIARNFPLLTAPTTWKMTAPKIVRLDGALDVVLGVKTAITVHADVENGAALSAVLVKPR